MKVREIMRLLREDGWFVVRMRGSHRQLKHRHKPGRVTVAGFDGDDLAPGTVNSILKQARLKDQTRDEIRGSDREG
ncbi:MAG TPA: type II toxin-antitoxin system HicA family toxin [Gammaproteobacteria bacterium]|nr:type II toxin-antitoxin system HicA family toxin [Gammaproteobacteria bacterium]